MIIILKGVIDLVCDSEDLNIYPVVLSQDSQYKYASGISLLETSPLICNVIEIQVTGYQRPFNSLAVELPPTPTNSLYLC